MALEIFGFNILTAVNSCTSHVSNYLNTTYTQNYGKDVVAKIQLSYIIFVEEGQY